MSAPYLRKELRGLAAGAPWPCDFGPDLSRGFRALKTWFTLKVYGTAALGSVITHTCALAQYLENRIAAIPELELLAPVDLNVVCFRYRGEDAQRINPRIVIELQESGLVAPSTTILDGRLAIRVAIVNHRTGRRDIDILVEKPWPWDAPWKPAPPAAALREPPAIADWPPQRARESALHDLEARIAADPDAVSLRFERRLSARRIGPDAGSPRRVPRPAGAGSLAPARAEQSGNAAASHRIPHRRAHRLRRSRGAPSRRPYEPRESGQCSLRRRRVSGCRASSMKPPCAPTRTIARRTRASPMCWLNSATKKARSCTGAKVSRIARSPRCRIAAKVRRSRLLLLVSSVGGNIPTRASAGRPRLPDVRGGARVLRSRIPLPPAPGGVQRHRRCRSGRARADCRAVHRGSHVRARDQSAFRCPGDRTRRSRALARLPGVVTPTTVTLPRELLSSPGRRRHGGAPWIPASRCWCEPPAFIPGVIFCASKARRPGRRGRRASRKRIDRHRVPQRPRRRWQGAQVSRR